MRISIALLALPALAVAQEQIPLLDRVQPYVNQAISFVTSFTGQTETGGSQTAPNPSVRELKLANWEGILRHEGRHAIGDVEPWMVYVTGGNKSCLGNCVRTDAAWDTAANELSSSPTGPNLALLDCDRQTLLCGAWGAAASTVWYMQVPKPNSGIHTTPLTITGLNSTVVTASDITKIHTKQAWKEQPNYEGLMHPLDGALKQFGVQMPLAIVLFLLSKIPSPVFMIGLSFFSRYFVNRRMPGAEGQQRAQTAAAAAAPPAGGARAKKNR